MIFLTMDGDILSYDKLKDVWSDGHTILRSNEKNWPCLPDREGKMVEIEGHLIEDPTALQHLEGKRDVSYHEASVLHFFFTLLYPFLWALAKLHSFRIDRHLTLASKAAAKNKIGKAATHIQKSLRLLGAIQPRYRNPPGEYFGEKEDKEDKKGSSKS